MSAKFLFPSILFCLLCLPFSSEGAEVLGELVLVEGGVSLKEGAESLPLEAGQALAEGDQIETDGEGTVEITLGSRNQVVLSPNSTLIVKKATKGKGLIFELNKGLIRAKLDNWQQDESFTIRTPSAVAGVRGTDFVVEASQDKGFELDVLEGNVQVDSNDIKGERFGMGKGLRLDRLGRLLEKREAIRKAIQDHIQKNGAFREALKAKWANRKKGALLQKFKGFNKGERLKKLKTLKENLEAKAKEIRNQVQEGKKKSQLKKQQRQKQIRDKIQQGLKDHFKR